jgi:L-alanine-DL-glutamate epimerase-like enolase superfamily enzyme
LTVIIKSIQASALAIPFNVAFKHASAERAATQSLWAEAHSWDGVVGFGEGCPREYVTRESLDSAQAFIGAHRDEWLGAIRDLGTLSDWARRHHRDIDAHPAAWTAVELALLDLLGKVEGKSVEALLRVPELAGRFQYTAVLGDASPREFEAQLARYLQAGFRDFKIKLSGDHKRDLAKVRALTAAGLPPEAVRADANNVWSEADAAIGALAALEFPFFALEEPLRAGDYAGLHRVASVLGTRIILDESFLRADQFDALSDQAERWIVNLRVSKMGGLLRSLELVREARRRGLRLVVGAHVGETSLLARAGLTVANSAPDILVAQEGAFGTRLLVHDVVEPLIIFGKGGVLDAGELKLGTAGFGLVISVPRGAAIEGASS